MEKRNKYYKELALRILGVVLLVPSMMFWSSVVMVVAFGTDYFYDEIFAPMARNVLGKTALFVLLVGFPLLGIFINRKDLQNKNWKRPVWLWVISGIFSVLGMVWIIMGVTI
jgi:hypothetical protein